LPPKAHIDEETYRSMYQRSVDDPEGLLGRVRRQFVTWYKKWDKVMDYSYGPDDVHIRWFEGGKLNVSYNCLDRHLTPAATRSPSSGKATTRNEDRKITYRELHEEVCKLANVMKARGVQKGDRVCIYMPMIPEAAVAMLACTRIGAVHSIVFGGFSPDSLRDRINDSECRLLITSDESVRGGRHVPLKKNADKALDRVPEHRHLHRRAPHRRRGRLDRGPRRLVPRGHGRRLRRAASRSRWTPRTRCSSSTPPAPPASRRACCTPPAATWSSRR
jgi:acetyl-CoA synthetase